MTIPKGDTANTLLSVLDSKAWFVAPPPLSENEQPSLLHLIRSGLYRLTDAVGVVDLGCCAAV